MKNKSWLRVIGAVLAGEIALILLAIIAQEVLFGGISYDTSSSAVLIFGGIATFLAAVGAGYVARWVAKQDWNIVPTINSILVMTETIYLFSEGITKGPFWFEMSAGLSLVVGIWIGFHRLWKGLFLQLKATD